MNLFIGMKPWEELRGDRVIVPLDDPAHAYDLHNNAYIYSIAYEYGPNESSKTSEQLMFRFKGRRHATEAIDQVGPEETFALIFYDVTNVQAEPSTLLPFKNGKLEMDDFVYSLDAATGKAHIGWFGDTQSQKKDPKLEFFTSAIEFQKI